MRWNAKTVLGLLGAGLVALTPATASAQADYPSMPIRLVLGYAPGAITDLAARLLAQKLASQMNASVVVDNKPGASGHIANAHVAAAKPDGYTLLFNDAGLVTGRALGEKLTYDMFKDLAPVSLAVSVPLTLFTHPSVPAKTIGEFVAHLRANPDKLFYASSGIGAPNHLGPLLVLQANGLSAVHVPYKGGGPAMLDVVSGQIQFGMQSMTAVLPMAKDNRINVLAFASTKRSPLLPEVPTLAETIMPGFETGNWFGVHAPAGTPPAILARLNAEVVKAMQDPEMKDRLAKEGAEALGSTPEQYAAYLKSELERWTKVVTTAGIKVE